MKEQTNDSISINDPNNQINFLINSINEILLQESQQIYLRAPRDQIFFIFTQKELQKMINYLKNQANNRINKLNFINQSIIEDVQYQNYTYYENILGQEIPNTQNLSKIIKIVSKQLMIMIRKEIECLGLHSSRRLMKIQGNQYSQVHLNFIQIQIMDLTTLKKAQLGSNKQISFRDTLLLKKIRVAFQQNESVNILKDRIRRKILKGNTPMKLYQYDSTLFEEISFFRMIQYYFKQQNIQYAANKNQKRFYELLFEPQLPYLLQFFPGKLLEDQKLSVKIKKLILEIFDEKWIFPKQPYFSVAKPCQYCLMRHQLYLMFVCTNCNKQYFFCTQICHYQFLVEHTCKQAKEELQQTYYSSCIQQNGFEEQEVDELSFRSSSQSGQQALIENGIKQDSEERNWFGGMQNLLNTCYLNASLQNLIRTSLSDELLNMQQIIRKKSSSLSRAYLTLIKKLKQTPSNHSVSSQDMSIFKDAVNMHIKQFNDDEQHDAHQFIMFFLDSLAEQLNLNKSINQPLREIFQEQNDSDEMPARNEWFKFISKNSSPIINLFYGQLKMQIDCPYCKMVNKTFDSFNMLSISIPEHQNRTVDFFFETYMFKQKIKYLNFEASGSQMEDIIKKCITILGLPPSKLKMIRAYILGYEGQCRQIRNNELVQLILSSKKKAGEKQCQLFLQQLPNQDPILFFCKFLNISQNPITCKRPLFFTQSHREISNMTIYDKVINYFISLAQLYSFKKSQHLQLKRRILEKIQKYFKIQLVINEQFGRKKRIPLLPNNEIREQLNQKCQLWVIIQNFKNISFKQSEFYNLINEKPNKYVKFNDYNLNLKNNLSQIPQILQQCLMEQLNKRQLLSNDNEWYCPSCNEKRRVYRITHLYKANKYLFIHIKRFKQGRDGKYFKNQSKVQLPLELDLHHLLSNPTLPECYYLHLTESQLSTYHLPKTINQKKSFKFKLIGLILHHGSIQGGHYTALFKSKEWWEYNDQNSKKMIDIENFLMDSSTMKKVYILLYERMEQ